MPRTTQPPQFPVTKVPGTFDGTKYDDIRVLLPPSIADYYKKNCLWEYIATCKFYNESDVVWFYNPKSKVYVKHKWGYRDHGYPNHRYIISDDYQQERPK